MGVMITHKQCGCKLLTYDNGIKEIDPCGDPACTTAQSHQRSSQTMGWIVEEIEQENVGPIARQIIKNIKEGNYTESIEDTEEGIVRVCTQVSVEIELERDQLEFIKVTGEA